MTGILFLNFGEPETPTRADVVPFLERIFYSNAPLEQFDSEEALRARCTELAERRAPSLIEDYKKIGGSPLNPQARHQAEALTAALKQRGHDVTTYVGMQYTDPTIRQAVEAALADGVDRLVGFTVYPLCGFTTNVASLNDLWEAADDLGFTGPRHGITGWHHHARYVELRADNIRRYCEAHGLDLTADDTLLYFSAHGTPIKYLEAGSRYDGYVEESCRQVAEALGGVAYTIGYQNHSNRGIPWTQPDNEAHVETVEAKHLVVEPISFLHEQSETLAELDIDFKEEVEELGMTLHRVPVPHDHPLLGEAMADLVEPFLKGTAPEEVGLHPCRCRAVPGTFCTNGHREVVGANSRQLAAREA